MYSLIPATDVWNRQNRVVRYRVPGKEFRFLRIFKRGAWFALIVASLLQCTIFFSLENVFAVSCVVLAWSLTSALILNERTLSLYTLSTFLLLGYSLTQYLIPVVFTIVELKPITYNLRLPYAVFIHSLLSFIILLIAHSVYLSLVGHRSRLKLGFQRVLSRWSLYRTPSRMQIWLMGYIGLCSMFLIYFYAKQEYENISTGFQNKLLEGLIPFAYAPFYLLFSSLYGKTQRNTRRLMIGLVIFTAFLIAVGIGGNSRGLFIIGPTGAVLTYFLGLLLKKFNPRIFTLRNSLLALIAFWLLTGPLSEMATAMLVVRSQRGSISKTQMLKETVEVYRDKHAIKLYNAALRGNIGEWNETYFNNIFLARFSNLKFNDANLEQAYKLGTGDPQMREYSINRLLAIFPQPLLTLMQVDIKKEHVIASSFGDYLFYRAGGGVSALGGFRTGQFSGTGMAAFGWWYLALLGVGIIPVFFLIDLFVVRKFDRHTRTFSTFISFVGLLTITSIFMFLSLSSTSESTINLFTYILRGWIQMVVLYIIMYYVTRLAIITGNVVIRR